MALAGVVIVNLKRWGASPLNRFAAPGLWKIKKQAILRNLTGLGSKTWSSFTKNPSSGPEFDAAEMKSKSDD
ncbi:hypothetical protein [Bosea sp. Tri-44]|uniref:hypothetical protein n=1 Tax=Bosea sp. Tri-44 TaxID=1972137 RepID=UPI00100DD841|nr:hypothetical protein [Bosea sp. Tri-44]